VSRPREQRYDLILFDLDGTLTDPKPGITRSVQFALARLGVTVADPDELVPFIGPPLAESFGRFYDFDAAQCRLAIEHYRERFASVGLYENAVYPGIPELLERLITAGTTLAIASSNPTVYVERILAHFALDRHFATVTGSNLDYTRVAKEEVVDHVLSLHPGINAARTVMVGDREHDIFGARQHGLETIAAGYGYGSAAELTAAGPLAIAKTVTELATLLAR
jgi:phosphoglycolate phosphatase